MIPRPFETASTEATRTAVAMGEQTQRQESMGMRLPIHACYGDATRTGRRRRTIQQRVQFATTPCVIDDGPYDLDRVWWQRHELNEIIHAGKTGSKDFGRRGLLMEGLDQAYNRARRIATAVDDDDRLARRLRDIQVNDGLVQWSRHGHSRRGLEKWCSKSQHRVRSEAARHQRAAVVGFEGDDMDELARLAQVTSKTARIFARLIGEADAIAVAHVAPEEKSVCALGIAGRRFSMPSGTGEQATTNEIFQYSVPVLLRSPGTHSTFLSSAPPAPSLRRSKTIPFDEVLATRKLDNTERLMAKPFSLDSPRTRQVASSPKTVVLPDIAGFMKKN